MTSRRPASWSLRTTESSALRRRSAASKRNAWTPRGRFGSGRSVFTWRSPEVQEEVLRKRRRPAVHATAGAPEDLSLIHISEPTRLGMISYAVFCLKKKTCVYAQETLTFLLTQKKTCVKNYVQKE